MTEVNTIYILMESEDEENQVPRGWTDQRDVADRWRRTVGLYDASRWAVEVKKLQMDEIKGETE